MQENGEEKCYAFSENEISKEMQKTYFSKKGLLPPALIRKFSKEQKALKKEQKQEQAYMQFLEADPAEKCDAKFSSFSDEDKDYIKYRLWCSPWTLMEGVARCENIWLLCLKNIRTTCTTPVCPNVCRILKKARKKNIVCCSGFIKTLEKTKNPRLLKAGVLYFIRQVYLVSLSSACLLSCKTAGFILGLWATRSLMGFITWACFLRVHGPPIQPPLQLITSNN